MNMETPDGKKTLHATVGICYQNLLPELELPSTSENMADICVLNRRPRRRFAEHFRSIPPFRTSLKLAKFPFNQTEATLSPLKPQHRGLDFLWLVQSVKQALPLFNGYFSQFVTDVRPRSLVAYMDPISEPPTKNDVVQETMIRSLNVAKETNQNYAVVSYDLAIALKAYSIQALQSPKFDKLVILLGNFHLEMAFFGAVGTYITESGIEYLLTEAGVLGSGSLAGFLKGKFYNRCTRIHQMVALVMEKAIFERYTETLDEDEMSYMEEVMQSAGNDFDVCMGVAHSEKFENLLEKYDSFLDDMMNGKFGSTACFWAIYVYFINRVYRSLERAVRTNNVSEYLEILPLVVEIFSALNRPNYAR